MAGLGVSSFYGGAGKVCHYWPADIAGENKTVVHYTTGIRDEATILVRKM